MLQKFIANDLNTAKNKMRRFTLRDDTEQRKRRLTQEKVLLSFYNKILMPIDVPKEDLITINTVEAFQRISGTIYIWTHSI